jgi:hypothetical protein
MSPEKIAGDVDEDPSASGKWIPRSCYRRCLEIELKYLGLNSEGEKNQNIFGATSLPFRQLQNKLEYPSKTIHQSINLSSDNEPSDGFQKSYNLDR